MTQGFSVNPELLDIHYPLRFNHHPKRNAVLVHSSPGAAPHPTSPPALEASSVPADLSTLAMSEVDHIFLL